MISNGARLALGSDFPVEGINPLLGFYAAVTRLSTDGESPHGPDGWYAYRRRRSTPTNELTFYLSPTQGSRNNL